MWTLLKLLPKYWEPLTTDFTKKRLCLIWFFATVDEVWGDIGMVDFCPFLHPCVRWPAHPGFPGWTSTCKTNTTSTSNVVNLLIESLNEYILETPRSHFIPLVVKKWERLQLVVFHHNQTNFPMNARQTFWIEILEKSRLIIWFGVTLAPFRSSNWRNRTARWSNVLLPSFNTLDPSHKSHRV